MNQSKVRIVSRSLWIVGLVLFVAFASPVRAYIPASGKLMKAFAGVNRRAERSQGLRLEVELIFGSQDSVARGELLTHPNGLARLELHGASGQNERHLLRGVEYLATRNGEKLTKPRPFLFPAYLLQADDEGSVESGMHALGIAVEEVALGSLGNRDCYVIGGRNLGAREERSEEPRAAAWIDMNTYDLVSIDLATGLRYRLGPPEQFDGIQLPKWVEIEQAGLASMRLEIRGASKATASAQDFRKSWLLESPSRESNREPNPAR